jgi:two-component system nitrogen regulation sensor histidine kinase NtrY
MGFKKHRLTLVLTLFLVVICSIAFGWAIFSSRLHLAIVLFFLILTQVLFLYRLLNRTQNEILFFFKALKNDDTSLTYRSSHRSRFTDELHHYLNVLNETFREMKINHEKREQYFSQILENLSSGLLVVSKTGHVNHINQEALRLFSLPQLTHLKALSEVDEKLHSTLNKLKSLEKSEFTLQDPEVGMKKVLGLQSIEINLRGEDVRVITVQDLSAEMERKEIDDWIRLIRILSHEIMNSLAPITSISTTLKEVWEEDTEKDDSDPKIRQTLKGLDAIAEQSEGLTTFFESYRVLSRIPDPSREDFSVCTLFDKLETLAINNKEYEGIAFTFSCEDPGLTLFADEQMITQVMLNLIKNAAQALDGVADPIISVQARPGEDSKVSLSVNDNGHGITADISDEIFLPFFTTRMKGTGVGLSYSRQVMNMNGGTIDLDSVPGRTEFRLLF